MPARRQSSARQGIGAVERPVDLEGAGAVPVAARAAARSARAGGRGEPDELARRRRRRARAGRAAARRPASPSRACRPARARRSASASASAARRRARTASRPRGRARSARARSPRSAGARAAASSARSARRTRRAPARSRTATRPPSARRRARRERRGERPGAGGAERPQRPARRRRSGRAAPARARPRSRRAARPASGKRRRRGRAAPPSRRASARARPPSRRRAGARPARRVHPLDRQVERAEERRAGRERQHARADVVGKPGSVSSSVCRPPPTWSAASRTSTSTPACSSTIAAASPFGPGADDERAGHARSARRAGPSDCPPSQHRLEQVAVLVHARERLAHAEVARPHLLAELLPAQRRRDRRARLWPHRVRRGDRLAVPVLPVVDEHAAALLLQPLRRHEPRVLRFELRETSSANSYVSGYE